MKRVFICARFHPDESHTLESNISRAKFACARALEKGYAPFAPHLLYHGEPDGFSTEEDIDTYLLAGLSWLSECAEVWQWGATVASDMITAKAMAKALKIPIKVFNSIGIPKEQWNAEGVRQ